MGAGGPSRPSAERQEHVCMIRSRVPSPAAHGRASWLDEGAGASTAVAGSERQSEVFDGWLRRTQRGAAVGAGEANAERRELEAYSVVGFCAQPGGLSRAGWMRAPEPWRLSQGNRGPTWW